MFGSFHVQMRSICPANKIDTMSCTFFSSFGRKATFLPVYINQYLCTTIQMIMSLALMICVIKWYKLLRYQLNVPYIARTYGGIVAKSPLTYSSVHCHFYESKVRVGRQKNGHVPSAYWRRCAVHLVYYDNLFSCVSPTICFKCITYILPKIIMESSLVGRFSLTFENHHSPQS